ncbi:hypothetical protein BKA62DRAFT_706272 [Auriculariales sp. MPI-PUGE-AT-0066]|nr:hypothetical protein BKA62DRAFT_706272 [Auriculariales sp. MPI-PUGE-AT-0066]
MPISRPPPQPSADRLHGDLLAFALQTLGATATECVVYGLHFAIVFALLANHATQWRQRYVSLGLALLLFSICTMNLALSIHMAITSLKTLSTNADGMVWHSPMDNLEWVHCAIFIIALMISDGILTWRVCVLYYRKSWAIVGVQCSLLVPAVVLGLVSFSCMLRAASGHLDGGCSTIMFQGQQVVWVLSGAVHVLATGLLARIAWRHHGMLKRSGMSGSEVARVLYILALSSVIYCLLWIPLIGLLFAQVAHPTFVGPVVFARKFFQHSFHQLVGVYPTVVTYFTLSRSAIFGKDPVATSSRTRGTKPTIRSWNATRSAQRNLQVSMDDEPTLQWGDDLKSPVRTPNSAQEFLPMSPMGRKFADLDSAPSTSDTKIDPDWPGEA